MSRPGSARDDASLAVTAIESRRARRRRGGHPDRVTTTAPASGTLGCMGIQLPWPVRSVIAGTTGTAALTLAYALERRFRPRVTGPLDYDDGLVPGEIVAGIIPRPHVTAREDRALDLVLRWSYGSAFGLLHGVLRRSVGEPWASVGFGGTLMTATLTMFPLLGRTPPPWRWRPDVMATSLATHACYVGAVAAVDDQILRRTR